MMKDKEKWVEDVFDSIKGIERAKPNADIFAKIERCIDTPDSKLIPMNQWRMAVAAAIVLLVLNVFAIQQYTSSSDLSSMESLTDDTYSQVLVSNYKLYE